MKRNEDESLPHTTDKKLIPSGLKVNVKCKTIKILKDDMEEALQKFEVRKDFVMS